MQIKTHAFFGEQGYTCTSLNHLANLAKEKVTDLENKIRVQLYTKTLAIIGQEGEQVISRSSKERDIELLPEYLKQIAKLHGFMAYAREAIKHHETMIANVKKLTFEWYCTNAGITLPAAPRLREYDLPNEYKEKQNIKQITRRLMLEAEAAVLGKFIHPNGILSEARKVRKIYQVEPIEVHEDGCNTLLRKYYFDDIKDETIENTFFQLQALHRSVQAQINQSEHDIKETTVNMAQEAESEYASAKEAYDNEISVLKNKWRAWVLAETKRVAALKIIMPNELQPIVNELNELGK